MAKQMMQDKASEMAATQTVPTGYKQTEVGVIPEDWDIKELQQICRVPITYGIVQCGPHIVNGIPYIRVSDMTARELDIDGMQRTSPQIAAAFARSTVDEGDIVYALRGKLGFVRSVPSSVAGANLTQGTARISPVPNVFGRYVFWALQSPRSLEQATQGAKGSTFVEITLASLKEIKIPVPRHKEEQKVIADALSDIDELIAGLEQLIAKKQAIKTAAMQQLLTGRTRLPAFALRPDGTTKGYKTSELGQIPEDWEVRYLKEVCGSFKTGKLDANAMKTDGEYRFYTCARSYYWIDSYAFDDDALLISGNGANVGYIHHYNGKFNAYQRTYVLTSFYSDIHFVKLQMEVNLSERIRVEVNAGNTPYITMDTLTDMCICLPKSIEEQTAIATILSDIDSELTALEQKLAKARDVKQGMMQQLLTGRIRLPLEVGA
ncbi:restriction endonuclease subunit S [Aeromonas hydrophila]|uniref:restriction endonuclease subunit S n=1 Tax=Aeromonas hydrophila TaxID=644 RepID=UPI002B4A99BA|nr:restriction endonuclease subunit S [Aeromonas hydrophila]